MFVSVALLRRFLQNSELFTNVYLTSSVKNLFQIGKKWTELKAKFHTTH